MTLDEAIKHCEEVAEENEKFCYKKGGQGGYFNEDTDWNNAKCAAEHRQLAEWLTELKPLREQTTWIPVSERLPNKPNVYIVTDSKGDVVRFVFNDTESSREYWLRCAKAWMPLPKPFEPQERSGEE